MHLFKATCLATTLALCAASTANASSTNGFARATEQVDPSGVAPKVDEIRRHVDLVLALDVSGSMRGLIDSAKQRLWDIVNTIGGASPTPRLRVAIISFGNPAYGAQTGFVRIDQGLTTDLDEVNAALFGFSTNGGSEYVARAVQTAIDTLAWSEQQNAIKIVVVAGNESAEQDPEIRLRDAIRNARANDVVVSTIYCGPEQARDARGWRLAANRAGGFYASIDQHVAATAAPPTPMDSELAELDQAFNQTLLHYGERGRAARENMERQDNLIRQFSSASAASRAQTKASALYRRPNAELGDAIGNGAELESIPERDLPEEVAALPEPERREFIEQTLAQRDEIKRRIEKLSAERRAYLQKLQRQATAGGADKTQGFDQALLDGLRQLVRAKGLDLPK